jgi:hypothetical protein
MTEQPSYDEVVAMVEGEETRPAVMSSQPPENSEAKIFLAKNLSSYPRAETREDPAPKCDYCKKERHRKEGC